MFILGFLIGVTVGTLFSVQVKKLALWCWEEIKALLRKKSV